MTLLEIIALSEDAGHTKTALPNTVLRELIAQAAANAERSENRGQLVSKTRRNVLTCRRKSRMAR